MLPGEELDMEARQIAHSEAAEQACSGVNAPGGPPEPLPTPVLGLWSAALQCLGAANADKARSSASIQ